MERRAFLAMPFPSVDNCQFCGFELDRGEHGIIGPAVAGQVSIRCLVPFKKPVPMPKLDVLYGRGYVRRGTDENGDLVIEPTNG